MIAPVNDIHHHATCTVSRILMYSKTSINGSSEKWPWPTSVYIVDKSVATESLNLV